MQHAWEMSARIRRIEEIVIFLDEESECHFGEAGLHFVSIEVSSQAVNISGAMARNGSNIVI